MNLKCRTPILLVTIATGILGSAVLGTSLLRADEDPSSSCVGVKLGSAEELILQKHRVGQN